MRFADVILRVWRGWKRAWSSGGVKIKAGRNKTDYMSMNEREKALTVRPQGPEVVKLDKSKYLGSTVHSTETAHKR